MTNEEWLDYMAHNDIPGLNAWFKAERLESPTSDTMRRIGQVIEDTVKRGVYGDTEPQDADSREKLEADIYKIADDAERFYYGERFINTNLILRWLDRQAAITAEETSDAWEEYRDATQREIAELTAERDKLKELNGYHAAQYELASEDCDRLQAQVDELTAECDELKGQVFTLKGECEDLENELHELTTERDEAREECIELHNDILRVNSKCDRYRLMCSEMATKIQDALSIADEGLA